MSIQANLRNMFSLISMTMSASMTVAIGVSNLLVLSYGEGLLTQKLHCDFVCLASLTQYNHCDIQ